MIEGRPFLYQTKNRIVYRVDENGVEAIQSLSLTKDTVAFVDDDQDNGPNYMLMSDTVQIILVSSLRGASAKWINQLACIYTLATKLWSLRELFLTGFVLGLLLSTLD